MFHKALVVIENIIHLILGILSKRFGKELPDRVYVTFIQFFKFGIVGFSNTLLAYMVYVLCLFLLHRMGILLEVEYYVAQFVAFVLSTLWAFYWNNKTVFTLQDGERRSIWKALIKTYISYSFTGLFLNTALLFVWVDVIHISEWIAPVINLFFNVPLNFIINKFWAFKKERIGSGLQGDKNEKV